MHIFRIRNLEIISKALVGEYYMKKYQLIFYMYDINALCCTKV